MHLLLMIRDLGSGGSQRQLVALANGAAARGVRTTVVVWYPGGERAADLDPAVQLVSLDRRGRFETVGFWRRWQEVLRQQRPDVVYSFLNGANVLAALGRRRPGRPLQIWGLRSEPWANVQHTWPSRLVQRLHRWLAPRADLLLSNAHATAATMRRLGYPDQGWAVVANGTAPAVPAAQWSNTDQQLHQRCQALGKPLLGMVARLARYKGQDALLAALAAVRQHWPDAALVLVGAGSPADVHRLQQTIKRHQLADCVLLTGAVANPWPAYAALDLYCHPAAAEGCPNAVAEALSIGLPVLATDVGDTARLLGDVGRVLPDATPATLATAILDGLADPAWKAHCQQAGPAHMQQHFSMQAMVDGTLAALDGALAEQQR